MSYGIMMCGICQREIHQDDSDHTWRHCMDKTRICDGASKEFAGDGEGRGVFCGKDGMIKR